MTGEESVTALERAVMLRRRTARYATRYERELALSLCRLGVSQREIGHSSEAIRALEEAVDILGADESESGRELVLAHALQDLGLSLAADDRHSEAAERIDHAVRIWRRLVGQDPASFKPALSESLSYLGLVMSELGNHDRALAASNESVVLARTLPQENSLASARTLACALSSFVAVRVKAGQDLNRCGPLIDEAIHILSHVPDAESEMFVVDLYFAYRTKVDLLEQTGHRSAAGELRRQLDDLIETARTHHIDES